MYEILEKCSTKKTKASHPQPKKIFQAIILKKPERPVVQMAGGAVELQETDFKVIGDEALSRGSTRPRRKMRLNRRWGNGILHGLSNCCFHPWSQEREARLSGR